MTPLPTSNIAARTAILPAPPVSGSSPPTAATTGLVVAPVAVAVGDGVRGPPLITVTSGLVVAVGLGASTHLVTLTPLAVAVVVQKEPCAKALDASTRTAIKDDEVNSISLFTNPPLPMSPQVDPQPNRTCYQNQHQHGPPRSQLPFHPPPSGSLGPVVARG